MASALPEPFSIQEGAVHFKGRAVKGVTVDAATFEVLGPRHARDGEQVFLVLETKLKPIKRASAATFRVLGESYGSDGTTVFFREKAVRLKKGPGTPDTFRELDQNYGTDGHWMYFGTQQVEPPPRADFDWDSARMHPFEVNAVNRSDAVLTDGAETFLWCWGGGWTPLEGAKFDALHRLGEGLAGDWRHAFLSDGVRVWFEGAPLEGLDASKARVVGHSVIEDDTAVFCGLERLAHAPGELRWVSGDLYRTRTALHRLTPSLGERTAQTQVGADAPADVAGVADAYSRLIDRVLPLAFTIFDRFLPVEDGLDCIDFDIPPPGGVPRCAVRELDGGRVSVEGELDGARHTVEGLPSAWVSLLSRLWSLLRGRSDGFLVYVFHSGMLPDADYLAVRLARRVSPELFDLASALQAAGQTDEALAVTHLALSRADALDERHDVDGSVQNALPRVPWEFVGAGRYEPLRHEITVTTNLAVAKLIAAEGFMTHPDLRVRWEATNLLTGILRSSSKTKAILKAVLEPLLERTQHEPVGIVEELFWTALDSAAVSLTVDADVGRSFEYELLERVTKALIAGGVNVNINRVRLAEAYFGLGRDDEAEALIRELRVEDGDDPWPTPGPFVYRERYPSLEAAARASRERAHEAPRFKKG